MPAPRDRFGNTSDWTQEYGFDDGTRPLRSRILRGSPGQGAAALQRRGHGGPAAAATAGSRIASLGCFGVLAGPAVIGALTRVVGLNVTLVRPRVPCDRGALGLAAARAAVTVFSPLALVEGLRFQEYLVYVAHEMFVPGVT
jgi:hypothetical protein